MHVSIVTGASRGIGRAIVEQLSQHEDVQIIAIARNEELLNKLKQEFDNVSIVVGDVTQLSTCEKAIEIAKQLGQLDSLILNSGVLDPVGSIGSTSLQDWKRLYDVNFFSIVQLIQLALPSLKQSNGKVIAVSSGASTKSYSGWSAYGSSKAALNHLIQSVAFDEGIQTISIAPGVVDTNMQQQIRTEFGSSMSKEGLQRFIDLHESGQLVKPEVPATVLANLALRTWPSNINGKYLRYNDEELSGFNK